VSCDYNEKENKTEYMVFPYGQVAIPGKWERTNYNQVARQQFFVNTDSVTISITFGTYNKYEFNQDGSKEGFSFLQAFYEWESAYFKTYNLNTETVETDNNSFIVWRVFGNYKNTEWDTYFLTGERKGFVKNFAVMKTKKWTTGQKVDCLKKMHSFIYFRFSLLFH
jgi:hypothetical protein